MSRAVHDEPYSLYIREAKALAGNSGWSHEFGCPDMTATQLRQRPRQSGLRSTAASKRAGSRSPNFAAAIIRAAMISRTT
jgi:hypothetical protein